MARLGFEWIVGIALDSGMEAKTEGHGWLAHFWSFGVVVCPPVDHLLLTLTCFANVKRIPWQRQFLALVGRFTNASYPHKYRAKNDNANYDQECKEHIVG